MWIRFRKKQREHERRVDGREIGYGTARTGKEETAKPTM